jgi:hypothetical protein
MTQRKKRLYLHDSSASSVIFIESSNVGFWPAIRKQSATFNCLVLGIWLIIFLTEYIS